MSETENTEEKQIKVEKPWLFQPGVSGNPAGKPPGAKHLSTKLYQALLKTVPDDPKQRTYIDMLTERILADAIKKGNTNLINLIYDRVEGKPDQGVNLQVTNETQVSSIDVMEIAKRVEEELKKKKTK